MRNILTIVKNLIIYKRWQEMSVLAFDILAVGACYFAAYSLRFDGEIPQIYLALMVRTIPLVIGIKVVVLILSGLHRSMWSYASLKDLNRILFSSSVGSAFFFVACAILALEVPRSVFFIDWMVLTLALGGIRFFIRLTRPYRYSLRLGEGQRRRVLIVGAGDAGEMIIREILYHYNLNYQIVGLVDDNITKLGKHIHGVSVIGHTSEIVELVDRYHVQEIIIAIPSLSGLELKELAEICARSGAKYRTVPHFSLLVDGVVKVKELREVRLEDLLKRDEVVLSKEKISDTICGKTVMVTGAGGSIGSEICRQVAAFSPEKLILFEKSENPLFYFDNEISARFPKTKIIPLIGDICDRRRVKEVFSLYRPSIVFHAAAHKHVPLMETNSMEAIKNNVIGTKKLAEEAIIAGVEKFIMLSTDKAVNPTSLMGASKKIAEMYIEAIAKTNGTQFMAVRFGNVLGSEGSVIPTFRKQIERGGPIEITHPEIKRYFMTIPEAAGLVLEAGVSGKGGEIFILEMGQQIKIVDLAEDLIRLSGKILGKDIEIKYVGLRPGEKMFEELFSEDEMVERTGHDKIMIVKHRQDHAFNVFNEMHELEKIVENGEMHLLRQKLKQLIPSYTFTEKSNGDGAAIENKTRHTVLLQENPSQAIITH